MKFNKSAESDFWYVDCDGDLLGVVRRYRDGIGYFFDQNHLVVCSTNQMKKIAEFMESIEKQSGIDTTSTFTSNSDIK